MRVHQLGVQIKQLSSEVKSIYSIHTITCTNKDDYFLKLGHIH